MEAARGFFSGTPDEVLEASAGYSEFLTPEQIAGLRPQLTSDFTAIVASCAKKCGIPYKPAGGDEASSMVSGYPSATSGYPMSTGGY